MKKKYIILGIILTLGFLFLNNTLSEVKTVPKVSFESAILDYEKKEAGSFKIDKRAKWISQGKARITIDVDSIIKENAPSKDIIFVLDVSSSMVEGRLDQVKKDVKELATSTLSNPHNKAALITFDTFARRLLDFTNDREAFAKNIDELEDLGRTNYKAAFEEVNKLLASYKKENGKDVVVLFLTDGFPNDETPNEIAVYKEIKQKYPFVQVNAVQYEMGKQIRPEIKNVSDNQYQADVKGLNNVLYEAGVNPVSYDHFVITDYISKYFKGDIKNIKASHGKITFEGNKVTWDLGNLRTGQKATLEIDVEQVGENKEYYPTNDSLEFKTSLEKQKDEQKRIETPILSDTFKVIYEANAPSGCEVKNLEATKDYRPFEKVEIAKGSATCDGYIFNGYKLITDVKHLNDDFIEMPEKDVILRATWTKPAIHKSMDGTIVKALTLYETIAAESLGNDKEKGIDYSKVNSETNGEGVYLLDESKDDEKPVYFFRGTHNIKNNLIFGGNCYKIVRTTETGGVRIVYNGKPVNGACSLTSGDNTALGRERFNKFEDHKKYVGYMYGSDDHPYENTNDSMIKTFIDNWYKKNIKNKGFDNKIDQKAIYCGDRTEKPYNDGNSNGVDFGANVRRKAFAPSMKCEVNDSYGVEAGNKKLTYPVALLTNDEMMLAGALRDSSNKDFYLYTASAYWLLSPNNISKGYPGFPDNYSMMTIWKNGDYNIGTPSIKSGVRPVLTLSPSVTPLSGDGTQNNPYIV